MGPTRIFDLHADTLDALAIPVLDADLAQGFRVGPGYVGEAEGDTLTDFLDADGHLSLRAMSAFAWCQCMAVFVPDALDVEQSVRLFEQVSSTLPRHVAAHPDLMAVARTATEIEGVLEGGRTCALLTIENGKLLAASPDMVERIDRAGVHMVTLTWNAENPLASGNETHHGLTELGRATIRALEDRHIVCDVSHLNDEGFWELASFARRPFCASHSNSRAVCAHPRNLTDDQFRAIRDAGGVCGLNYFREFVSTTHADPTPDDVLAHLEHWLDLDGEDCVALGSDYDGCTTPSWLEPCEKVGDLRQMIVGRFGETVADKVCFENAHAFFLRCGR